MLPVALRAIQLQLKAMDADVYELGVRIPKEQTGKKYDDMLLRSGKTKDGPTVGLTVGEVLDESRLNWLARENTKGNHIYIRPFGPSRLTLIDDLNSENLQKLTMTGYTPSCVIETSPGNFQAWLKHDKVLSAEEGTIAARILAEKFGGDPNSADWRHFGRLAGYTNPKEKYRQSNGRFPFSKLNFALSQGQGYPEAQNIYLQVQQKIQVEQNQVQQAAEAYQAFRANLSHNLQRKVYDYQHFAGLYGAEGERHKADICFATHCLQRNVSEQEIRFTIRALTQTSSFVNRSKRDQESYLDRTISKARKRAGITLNSPLQTHLPHSSLSR